MEIAKHKVFISYYHYDDQYYKNELLRQNERYGLFQDYSVHENEIDDTGKTSERIRQIIRDDYIRDATVLVLLCGKNTSKRKHIDWELHAAMFDTSTNPKMGILVVNLPTISQSVRAGESEDRKLVFPECNSWTSIATRKEYENTYQYMPSRIIDNFITHVPISVVNWTSIDGRPEVLKQLVDNAFKRRKTNQYDHSALLRKYNS